jgi:hypothetical protein
MFPPLNERYYMSQHFASRLEIYNGSVSQQESKWVVPRSFSYETIDHVAYFLTASLIYITSSLCLISTKYLRTLYYETNSTTGHSSLLFSHVHQKVF